MPVRKDDLSISDSEPLWRRIHPQWIVQLSDGNVRPSSAAFLDGYTGEVSVHLATLTNKDSVLANHDPDSLAEILARHCLTISFLEVYRSWPRSTGRDS
jgi:hypothetical protein